MKRTAQPTIKSFWIFCHNYAVTISGGDGLLLFSQLYWPGYMILKIYEENSVLKMNTGLTAPGILRRIFW